MRVNIKLGGAPPVTFTVNESGKGAAFFIMGIRKCGSTMMNKVCFALSDINGVHFIDVSNGFFHNNIAAGDWIHEPEVAAILRPGNAYMGFRNMPVCFQNNAIFEAGRKILLVRDPRDAIVSEYFSNAYSHAIPEGESDDEGARGNLLAKRKIALESTVEDYARKHFPLMRKTFELYRDICADPNLLLLKYEDCIFDKVKMIDQILEHFGWTCSETSRDILLKSIDVRPQAENPKAFIRKVTPGDHKEKLSAETIRMLDRELGEILDFYGYAT